MKKIGIITYAFPHLKTEQLILSLLQDGVSPKQITVFALPFKERKHRDVFIFHRPEQSNAVDSQTLCTAFGIDYVKCISDTDINNSCDIYLVGGAGILSEASLEGKTVINAHPGIIPAARGLDSFKWSILNFVPLGVTLHYIDKNVDMGEVISVVETPVFITDSLETLARRHYETEIKVLASFEKYLSQPVNKFSNISSRDATMRMPFDTEVRMARMFDEYKERFAYPHKELERAV